MGEAFFKAIKWFFFVAFIIGGIAAMSAVEVHGIKTIILAVFSFGGAYVMSGPWRGLPKVPMIFSIALLIAMAVLARYLPDLAYLSLGKDIALNSYLIWAGLMFILGIPFMTIVFSKYKE